MDGETYDEKKTIKETHSEAEVSDDTCSPVTNAKKADIADARAAAAQRKLFQQK